MTAVYFVVPAGLNDERRPSGGNRYDRELARELSDGLGWNVQVRPVAAPGPARLPMACASCPPSWRRYPITRWCCWTG